jgi:hypothetical protein
VTSPCPCPLRPAYGASPKRVESALQPAAPTAISANALARGHDNGRNHSAKDFMSCSLERNKQFGELTDRR